MCFYVNLFPYSSILSTLKHKYMDGRKISQKLLRAYYSHVPNSFHIEPVDWASWAVWVSVLSRSWHCPQVLAGSCLHVLADPWYGQKQRPGVTHRVSVWRALWQCPEDQWQLWSPGTPPDWCEWGLCFLLYSHPRRDQAQTWVPGAKNQWCFYWKVAL